MIIRNRPLNGTNASLTLNSNGLTVRNRYNPKVKTGSTMVARTIPLKNIARVDYRQRTPTTAELVIKSRDRERSPMRTDIIKVEEYQMHHFRKLQQTITQELNHRPTRHNPDLPDLTFRGLSHHS